MDVSAWYSQIDATSGTWGQGQHWGRCELGPHLVTDQLPLLLVVVLVEQLHLVRGQVHRILWVKGVSTGGHPKNTPGAVAPPAHPALGVLAQQWDMGTLVGHGDTPWEDGDVGGRMGTPLVGHEDSSEKMGTLVGQWEQWWENENSTLRVGTLVDDGDDSRRPGTSL